MFSFLQESSKARTTLIDSLWYAMSLNIFKGFYCGKNLSFLQSENRCFQKFKEGYNVQLSIGLPSYSYRNPPRLDLPLFILFDVQCFWTFSDFFILERIYVFFSLKTAVFRNMKGTIFQLSIGLPSYSYANHPRLYLLLLFSLMCNVSKTFSKVFIVEISKFSSVRKPLFSET